MAGVVLADLRLLFGNSTMDNLHLVVSDSHVFETSKTSYQKSSVVSRVERHLHRVESRSGTLDCLLIVESNTIPSPNYHLDVWLTCKSDDVLFLICGRKCNR